MYMYVCVYIYVIYTCIKNFEPSCILPQTRSSILITCPAFDEPRLGTEALRRKDAWEGPGLQLDGEVFINGGGIPFGGFLNF